MTSLPLLFPFARAQQVIDGSVEISLLNRNEVGKHQFTQVIFHTADAAPKFFSEFFVRWPAMVFLVGKFAEDAVHEFGTKG